jgi:hypothetical protein
VAVCHSSKLVSKYFLVASLRICGQMGTPYFNWGDLSESDLQSAMRGRKETLRKSIMAADEIVEQLTMMQIESLSCRATRRYVDEMDYTKPLGFIMGMARTEAAANDPPHTCTETVKDANCWCVMLDHCRDLENYVKLIDSSLNKAVSLAGKLKAAAEMNLVDLDKREMEMMPPPPPKKRRVEEENPNNGAEDSQSSM